MRLAQAVASLAALFAPAPANTTAVAVGPAAKPAKPARGFLDPRGVRKRRIVVNIDEPTFERLSARAAADAVTVSETVRRVIARGLARASH